MISSICDVSPTLDSYAKKMTTIKRRVTVMHNILQNVQVSCSHPDNRILFRVFFPNFLRCKRVNNLARETALAVVVADGKSVVSSACVMERRHFC